MQIPTMRFKALLLFLSLILVTSCSKDETTIFTSSEIEVVNITIPDQTPVDDDQPTQLSKSVNWIENMQSSNGLLESSENTDFVSLYDNALAALVFMNQGELERAERIFDYFNAKLDAELLNGKGGFYQFRDGDGENGNRTWMGDNAWLLIALNHYHSITGNNEYQEMVYEIEHWLRGLQDDDGGLWGGYNEDGTMIPKVTEGIITAFNAVNGYDGFHKNILTFLKTNRWDAASEVLLAWPENPDYNYALDLLSLGNLIFENYPEHNLLQADRFFTTQISTVNGTAISGYCFDEDKDVVWLEGTGQMAAAFRTAGDESKTNIIISELEKSFINSASLSNSIGLPYTSNYGTTYGSNLLWNHADIAPALSATAWYIFAKTEFNPLETGRQKNIPISDKFWIKVN